MQPVFFPTLPLLKFHVPFYPGLTEERINPCVFCVSESMRALRTLWVLQTALSLLISLNLAPSCKVNQYQTGELPCTGNRKQNIPSSLLPLQDKLEGIS